MTEWEKGLRVKSSRITSIPELIETRTPAPRIPLVHSRFSLRHYVNKVDIIPEKLFVVLRIANMIQVYISDILSKVSERFRYIYNLIVYGVVQSSVLKGTKKRERLPINLTPLSLKDIYINPYPIYTTSLQIHWSQGHSHLFLSLILM